MTLLFPAFTSLGSAGAATVSDARDAAFREHVASLFATDCQRGRVQNASQARVLQRLCSCSVARIRSSDIVFGDGQDLVTRKVHEAQEACLGQVYGRTPRSR